MIMDDWYCKDALVVCPWVMQRLNWPQSELWILGLDDWAAPGHRLEGVMWIRLALWSCMVLSAVFWVSPWPTFLYDSTEAVKFRTACLWYLPIQHVLLERGSMVEEWNFYLLKLYFGSIHPLTGCYSRVHTHELEKMIICIFDIC